MKFAFSRGLVILTCLLLSITGRSQSGPITGKVVSGDDNTPLIGVTIVIKAKKKAVQSDTQGQFSIDAQPGDVLSVSYIGYAPQEITIGQARTLNITLTSSASRMDEVVITGYGSTKRSKLTSSIAKLDNKILETGLRSNPAQALAGTISGVRVATGSGRPGALPSIVLRGGTNFDGSGSPLVVIDGQVRGSLSDINPEDIGSLEVLKDAAATAIYGARASNGVILITSKRGKAGTTSINLQAKRGYAYMNSPYNFLNAEDYIKWTRMGVVEAIKNGTLANSALSGVGPRGTGNLYKDAAGNILDGNYDSRAIWSTMRLNDVNRELLNANDGWKVMTDPVKTNAAGDYDPNGTNAQLIYKDFNYGDYAFKSPAVTQDYNLGMSGGNERGKYYANLGYFNEEGLPLNVFYKRLTFTGNADYKIRDWVNTETGIQYAMANWRDQTLTNGEANYWGRMLSAPPTMRGTNTKGEMLLGRDASDGNPLFNADKYIRKNQSDKFTITQRFNLQFTPDLSGRIGAILYYDESFNESFNKDFRTGIQSYTNPNTGWNRDRSSSAAFDRTIRQTYNATLSYKKQINRHSLDALAGFEYFDAYNKGVGASGRLAPTDDFMDLGLTLNNATTQTRGTDSYHARERIMSGFGNLIYDYDGKYIANFTVRHDGYSRLIGDNQYGTFPAGSIGWMAHKEEFMKGTSNWLSFLKLRASYGINGNIGIGTDNAIGLYELQGSYGAQQPYNGITGFLQTGIANPKLKWEKSRTVEVGTDLGFFNNRLTASVAYYNRLTDDKLTYINLPTSAGISSIRTNNGSMRNRGVEMDLTYKVIQQKDLLWQVSANASWNKNTVVKLPYNGNEKNRQGGQLVYDPASGRNVWVGGLQEGMEWGEVYGFVSDGIIRNDKDLADYNKIDIAAGEVQGGAAAGKRVASQKLITEKGLTNHISTKLGDMMWRDLDRNDTIDYRDQTRLGRSIPRWTGGFNTTVSYKNFQLFARLDFALGHIQQDFMNMWALGSFQGEFNATDVVKDTWTPENPNAKYPRYSWADQLNTKNFDRPSNMFWVNSSYLCFRDVSLSYSIPSHILKPARISGLTLTVTGQNLGYITNSQTNLPERTGSQNSAYIIPTQLIFGANLKF
ncbi:SusC/RagA family TonB-linked outer membrane protein [Chitinophaga deserti]|uniref:SusC/RagA family TonB-linked outer membrane protein n=1 Tax=Chitinophaga deserti TaxID=2164099 RepID=UPI000D6CA208|nr:SusC/RagA family TonB-linked outer membrane protein [Chitinophaga deserti]